MDALIRKYFAFSVTDVNGVILDISDAFCECSGYSKEELIGKNHNIFRHEDMPDAIFEELWKTISSGKSWRGDIKNRNKDGSVCWGHSCIEPIFDAEGEIVGYFAAKYEINDKLMYKEELEKNKLLQNQLVLHSKEKAMNQMVSLIAHQWRQPLSSISLALTNIEIKQEMGLLDNATLKSALHKTKDIVTHLSDTIDVFGGYFKSKGKQLVSAQEMMQKIEKIILSIFESKGVVFEVSIEENFYLREEMDHVFLNLYQNAFEVLISKEQEKKIIKTTFYRENDKCYIKISDNGGGIEPDKIDRVFEAYFSTKTQNASGLGLYMSKSIVQEAAGSISVSNQGGGACFLITLPFAAI